MGEGVAFTYSSNIKLILVVWFQLPVLSEKEVKVPKHIVLSIFPEYKVKCPATSSHDFGLCPLNGGGGRPDFCVKHDFEIDQLSN